MGPESDSLSGEDRLIARFFAPLARAPGALGLADDAALIAPPPDCELVLKADAIVGGVHFFVADDAGDVARKALRVNLSDLAAKGASPLGFLLSLALPATADEHWLAAFAEGLRADCAHYRCPLLGGDTVRTPGPTTVSVAVIGSVPKGRMVRRAGARPGDLVFVTGTIGDAALGLALRRGATWALDEALSAHLRARYTLPQPRLALIEALRAYASAAMDVSDGLIGDLAKLCRVSGVAAVVRAGRVPLSAAAARAVAADPAALEIVLTGGDDYEVLCTVPPGQADGFRAAAAAAGVAVSDIGTIEPGANVRCLDADGKAILFKRAAYSHF
ncbi:MAG: thiamine-phosphate kinase [Pseudolabrys sp.]|nr:thiamine-phosphate kinase [Pseudolabrys sp.]